MNEEVMPVTPGCLALVVQGPWAGKSVEVKVLNPTNNRWLCLVDGIFIRFAENSLMRIDGYMVRMGTNGLDRLINERLKQRKSK